MKRTLVLLVLLAISASTALAQPAASKAAATSSVVNEVVISTDTSVPDAPFVTVLGTSIKPAGGKDLFITFSAQTGVFAASSNNNVLLAPTTFTLEAVAIEVQVLVDGVPLPIAPPSTLSIVSFDNLIRATSRTTPLQVDTLTQVVGEGGARSYTWVARSVGNGVHTVDVQARFRFANAGVAPANTFSAIAALIGPKTLTVEAVNLKD